MNRTLKARIDRWMYVQRADIAEWCVANHYGDWAPTYAELEAIFNRYYQYMTFEDAWRMLTFTEEMNPSLNEDIALEAGKRIEEKYAHIKGAKL